MVRRGNGGKREGGGTRVKTKKKTPRRVNRIVEENDRAIHGAVKSIASSVSHMERFMRAMNNKIGTTDRTIRGMATGLREQGERMTRLGERVGTLEQNLPLLKKSRPCTASPRKTRGSSASPTLPSNVSSVTKIASNACPLSASFPPTAIGYQTSGNSPYITLPVSMSPFQNPKASGAAPSASFTSENASSSSYTTEQSPIDSPEPSTASVERPPAAPRRKRVVRRKVLPKPPKPKKKVRRRRPSGFSISAGAGDPTYAASLLPVRSCLRTSASRPATSAGVCPCSCPDGCCCRRGGVKRCASCSLCNAMANTGGKGNPGFAEEIADALGSLLLSAAEHQQQQQLQQQQQQQGCWCCNAQGCQWCPKGKGKKKTRKVKKVKA